MQEYTYIYILDTYRRNDKDAGRLLYKIFYLSLLFVRFRKGLLKVCVWEGAGDQHNWNILTPRLWPSALCLSRSPWLLNRSPGFPYYTSSTSTPTILLVLNSTRLSTGSSNSTPLTQFVGLILPPNSHTVIWTRLHASAIFSDVWWSGCVTSAFFGMACVIVIKRK